MYDYKTFGQGPLEFIPVATTEELHDGERIIFDIAGKSIALFMIAGEYFAIADVCSHDDGPVAEGELLGHEIACPRHGARFDLRTGEVLSLPAVVDIPAYPVRIEGNQILIGLPIEE